MYLTENDETCKKIEKYMSDHWKCGHYPEHKKIRPYFAKWIINFPPFCLWSGGSNSEFCPSTKQVGNKKSIQHRTRQVYNGPRIVKSIAAIWEKKTIWVKVFSQN